jgi:protein phosphatase
MSKYVFRSYSQPANKKLLNLNEDDHRCSKGIAIIADGVSSSGKGMLAAKEAVHWAYLQLDFLKQQLESGKLTAEEIQEKIKNSILFTNTTLLNFGKANENYKGWATTLDCCLIHDDTAYIGHVGDSRVYHLARKGDHLEQLTKDHAYPKKDTEGLDGKTKVVADMSSTLENYIGKEEISVDILVQPMDVNDILFMATDGITKKLTEKTICRVLRRYNISKKLKNVLAKRLNRPSQYARHLQRLDGITYKEACKELTDDQTFAIIKRVK